MAEKYSAARALHFSNVSEKSLGVDAKSLANDRNAARKPR
jgi:hypothetical protein